jgi:nitroreductase
MDVIEAIRTRRTVKKFDPTPLPPEQLARVLEAARWAPNHRLTQPWRLRVVGPVTLGRLVSFSGEGGRKLLTAPHLVLASYVPSALPQHAEEDEHATAAAIYAVLLAATAEGLASFWRTPSFLRDEEGLRIAGVPEGEHAIGLVYLGRPAGELPDPPERIAPEDFITHLP